MISGSVEAMASNLIAKGTSNGLQPNGDGLQPTRDGLPQREMAFDWLAYLMPLLFWCRLLTHQL